MHGLSLFIIDTHDLHGQQEMENVHTSVITGESKIAATRSVPRLPTFTLDNDLGLLTFPDVKSAKTVV